MGAGYDTRPYRFVDKNQGTRIFELDIKSTQDRKKKCLKKAKISIPTEVVFVSIDFNQDSLLDTLQAAGWKSSEKTLFIWEGVSYYLEEDTVADTLLFFNQHPKPGSTLAFDYTITLTDDNLKKYYGAEAFKQTMEEHHASEALLFSVPESGIATYLDDHKLKMLEHLNYQDIEQNYLIDDNGSPIGKMTGHFCFALATT
jgi:methyltransferase (TIGR00027 family)